MDNWILHFVIAMFLYIISNRNWLFVTFLIFGKEIHDVVLYNVNFETLGLIDSFFDIVCGFLGMAFGELIMRE